MSEKSLSVGAAIDPELYAVLGLCAGYTFAPRKYSLKNLVEMSNDKFERQFPRSAEPSAAGEKRNCAVDNIIEARKKYRQAYNSNEVEIREKAILFKEKFDRVEIPKDLEEEYIKQINLHKNLAAENDFTNINRSYLKLKSEALQKPGDSVIQENFRNICSKLGIVREKLSGTIEAYNTAFRNILIAKHTKIAENPEKYIDITEAYNDLQAAIAKRDTAVSGKLFELTNEENLKRSYDEIKGSIPKARLKYAAIWAISLGVVAAIVKFIVNKTSDKSL